MIGEVNFKLVTFEAKECTIEGMKLFYSQMKIRFRQMQKEIIERNSKLDNITSFCILTTRLLVEKYEIAVEKVIKNTKEEFNKQKVPRK